MNKIDLIIECMDQILNDELPTPENMMKAFHYACELKALKPVLWKHSGDGWSYEKPLFPATPLYALDEVKK